MNIQLTDLIVKCEKCGGKGMINEGSERMGHQYTCGSCRGEGKLLTDAGRVLKEFITEVTHHQYA